MLTRSDLNLLEQTSSTFFERCETDGDLTLTKQNTMSLEGNSYRTGLFENWPDLSCPLRMFSQVSCTSPHASSFGSNFAPLGTFEQVLIEADELIHPQSLMSYNSIEDTQTSASLGSPEVALSLNILDTIERSSVELLEIAAEKLDVASESKTASDEKKNAANSTEIDAEKVSDVKKQPVVDSSVFAEIVCS